MKNPRFLILKTDIQSSTAVGEIAPFFDRHPLISRWCVDIEDIDNVLKIETSSALMETDVVAILSRCGFQGEELPD